MPALQRALVSEREFLELPETLDKVELVDGEVHVSPSPSYWHQELLRRIVFRLSAWAEGRRGEVTVGQAPLDIAFGRQRILQPDAFVLLDRVPADHEGPLQRVPEVCVEVVSADRVYDRVTKRLIYAAAGVLEYWVVEPAGLIERRTGAGLAEAEEVLVRLATPLLPGFELDVRELFRRS